MSWFTVIKNEVEYDGQVCCKDVVRDLEKYFIPFWDDLPVEFPTDIFPERDCDALIQVLENIENDGTLIWLNRVHGRSWTEGVGETGLVSDMQKMANMILTNYRDCSLTLFNLPSKDNKYLGDLR